MKISFLDYCQLCTDWDLASCIYEQRHPERCTHTGVPHNIRSWQFKQLMTHSSRMTYIEKNCYFYVQLMILGYRHHLLERQRIAVSFLVSLSLYYVFHFWSVKNNHINKHWPRGSRPEKREKERGDGVGKEGEREESPGEWSIANMWPLLWSFGELHCSSGMSSLSALRTLQLSQSVNKPRPSWESRFSDKRNTGST